MADLLPIDLVFTWCDSADPQFAAKRAEVLNRPGTAQDGRESVRHAAHDELKYALRAAEAHAPWIRTVFLAVSDYQSLPAWLDAASPRLRIVRHSEFIPAEYLPTFNSLVIEYHLHRIPGLAERFLYANDDTVIARPASPGFFFDPQDGFPFARYSGRAYASATSLYAKILRTSDALVRQRFGLAGDFRRAYLRAVHHNVDAYRRTDCAACYETFREAFAAASRYVLRDERQLDRRIFLAYALAVGRAHYREASSLIGRKLSGTFLRPLLGTWCTSAVINSNRDVWAECRRFGRPTLLCFNDLQGTTPGQYAELGRLMESLFPAPSSMERP